MARAVHTSMRCCDLSIFTLWTDSYVCKALDPIFYILYKWERRTTDKTILLCTEGNNLTKLAQKTFDGNDRLQTLILARNKLQRLKVTAINPSFGSDSYIEKKLDTVGWFFLYQPFLQLSVHKTFHSVF